MALDDGRLLAAPLLVAAEGRNSPTREAAGIPIARWAYDHVAIVATIAHERPHGETAYEIFYPDGPFAILPMLAGEDGRPRSAIVWSVQARDAAAMLGLPDRALAHEIEKRMGGFLGAVALAGPRWNYPLGFHHAAQITDRAAGSGRRRRPRHPSDRRPGPQSRLPRRRRAGRGAGRRARGSASTSATRSCSPATSAGAASTPSWSRWRPTA